MLSVDAVLNHVTGIRLSTVPMCSESGNLPVTELVYTIKWFTSLGADWDAARVYTGCCTAWQISDRELPPRSIYDILTQIWFSMVIYHIQCRQTFVVVDTVLLTYPEEPKQPRRPIAGLPLLEFSPALESWSDIYTGPTSWLIIPQTFSMWVCVITNCKII